MTGGVPVNRVQGFQKKDSPPDSPLSPVDRSRLLTGLFDLGSTIGPVECRSRPRPQTFWYEAKSTKQRLKRPRGPVQPWNDLPYGNVIERAEGS
jgi:hypothetical protein